MFSLQSNSDLIMDLDTLVKTLQLRFEGSDPHTMIQPPLLLKDIVVNIKGGEMTESQLQNIKLQLESLVGDLCELVTSKKGDESKGKGTINSSVIEIK